MPGTRKLGRTTDHRMAMLRAMVTYLLENGKIETTVTRAKEVRPLAEKMITLGKKGDLNAKRAAMAFITKEDVVKKVFDEIAPKYQSRNGGYTRIVRIGPRRGDAAEMAIIELVDYNENMLKTPKAAAKKTTRRAGKKAAPKAEEATVEAPVAESAE